MTLHYVNQYHFKSLAMHSTPLTMPGFTSVLIKIDATNIEVTMLILEAQ